MGCSAVSHEHIAPMPSTTASLLIQAGAKAGSVPAVESRDSPCVQRDYAPSSLSSAVKNPALTQSLNHADRRD